MRGQSILRKREEEAEGGREGKVSAVLGSRQGRGSGGREGFVYIVRGSVWQLWLLLSLCTSVSVCACAVAVADNKCTKSCIRKYTVGRMGIYTLYPVRGISHEWQQSLDITHT